MSEIDDLSELIGKPGERVPAVDAADIKVMWTYCQELKAQRSCGTSVNACDKQRFALSGSLLCHQHWPAHKDSLPLHGPDLSSEECPRIG